MSAASNTASLPLSPTPPIRRSSGSSVVRKAPQRSSKASQSVARRWSRANRSRSTSGIGCKGTRVYVRTLGRPVGALADRAADGLEARRDRVVVAREHRRETVAGDLGEVGVVDAGAAQVGDVAVAALVGTDVDPARLACRLPDAAVEARLAPELD